MDLSAKFASLSPDQINQLIENYAERVVNGMDVITLTQFAFDVIVENLNIQGPEEILNEISFVYDDDLVEELIDSVTA